MHAVLVLAIAISGIQDTAVRHDTAVARVVFNGQAVPGAVVTATRGDRTVRALSDAEGFVRFKAGDLDAGLWSIAVAMTGFEPLMRQIIVPAGPEMPIWTLVLQPIESYSAARAQPPQQPTPTAPRRTAAVTDEVAANAADGFLVNGSVNNAAASPFAQPRGFGNNRPAAAALYTGSAGLAGGTSRWDARPFAFDGSGLSVPSRLDAQLQASLGGPVKPWFAGRPAPRFFIAYQGSTRQTASSESLLVPTMRERVGDFSASLSAAGAPVTVRDPVTGLPFAGATVPETRVSPQALALLRLYPQPTSEAGGRGRYDATTLALTRQHDGQARLTHVSGRNIFMTSLAVQQSGTDSRAAFGFTDRARRLGLDVVGSWNRRFSPRLGARLRYQFTRLTGLTTPHFANRENVSAEAGIAGNDQSPAQWGPPRLVFPDMAALATASSHRSHAASHGINLETYVNRGRHTITIGADAKRLREDLLSQPDARGTFTFTGTATGVPFADFMLGLPATSALGTGNADKRLTGQSYAVYISDDARIRPTVTLTIGARWELDAPLTESADRLANLDLAPDFSKAGVVTASDRDGRVTDRRYPRALVTAGPGLVQPRLAVSWRPFAGSSVVFRGGYGVYRNTGLHQSLALTLAQLAPFTRTVLAAHSASTPLSLHHGFPATSDSVSGTFAVDPDIRSSYAHTWQASAQRELPGSLLVVGSYLGSAGRNLPRQVRPNTVPPGTEPDCDTCPSGFVYLTSDGRSSRHAAQLALRRRLRGGFAANVQYTLARAFDDAASFSGRVPPAAAVAQDWGRPEDEWAPSAFDRRHELAAQFQYTTGVGSAGARQHGWLRALVNGWTIAGDLNAGSGLPWTPVYLATLPGTGFVGLRPSVTPDVTTHGVGGRYANPEAFGPPAAGHWGDAGRHSLRGPRAFRFDLSVARSFLWGDRRTVEWRADITNVLNRVTFSDVHPVVGNPLFGFASRANPMRKLLTTLRVRF